MGDFIETVKLVGSIVGLLTGAFTAWDWLVRGRPIAFIALSPVSRKRVLRVKNVSQIEILVRIVPKPKSYKAATSNDARAMANAMADVAAVTILAPEETVDFPIFERGRVPGEPLKRGPVRFAVHWRKSNRTWVWQLPVRVSTSRRYLDRPD